ncbi:hypothetical protein [Paenibacillus periandrae]|uniref:hypothetical protein n=1 Tax=Paenibacillus periandrae TaxID=1761741 RepID=UPI003B82D1B6
MGQSYRTTKTTVSMINYHLAFARDTGVKWVEIQFKQLVEEICAENDWVLIAMEVIPDLSKRVANRFSCGNHGET